MKEREFSTNFKGTNYPVFYITQTDTAIEVLEKLCKIEGPFGLDTETMAAPGFERNKMAALNPYYGKIRLLQIFTGKSVVIFDMHLIKYSRGLTDLFQKFLISKKFVAHNALFDLQFLNQMFHLGDYEKQIDIGCTYILWKIITHATRPTDEGIRASLDILSEQLLGCVLPKILQASDWGIENLTYEQLEYSAHDSIAVLELFKRIGPAVVNLGCANYYKLCKEAQHPIAEMQLTGIRFNTNNHIALIDKWREDLYKAKKELVALTGLPKITGHTIADYFTKHLPADTLKFWPRTEEGKLMTDSHTLQDYADISPIVAPFAVYQKKEKLTTSFGTPLIATVNEVTGRLHASYNICGARTGRLSCRSPNLQQLPRDPLVRDNFIASNGYTLLCADYSQIELRVGAELSRDKAMLKAYKQGIDLHTLTAAIVGNKNFNEITKEDRQKAKAFNFGLMFGLGPRKFSRYARQSYKVEVTNEDAVESIRLWRKTYSGYRIWQLAQAESAAKTRRTKTAIGKVRCLDSKNCYGAAMNTPVQGSACECMLSALIYLDSALKKERLAARLCNCIHDEIIVDTRLDCVPRVRTLINDAMVAGFKRVFPKGITNKLCEVGEGLSWAKAKL